MVLGRDQPPEHQGRRARLPQGGRAGGLDRRRRSRNRPHRAEQPEHEVQLRLDARATRRRSSISRGDKIRNARGANSTTRIEATNRQTGPTNYYKAEHQWVASDRLMLEAEYSYNNAGFVLDFHEDDLADRAAPALRRPGQHADALGQLQRQHPADLRVAPGRQLLPAELPRRRPLDEVRRPLAQHAVRDDQQDRRRRHGAHPLDGHQRGRHHPRRRHQPRDVAVLGLLQRLVQEEPRHADLGPALRSPGRSRDREPTSPPTRSCPTCCRRWTSRAPTATRPTTTSRRASRFAYDLAGQRPHGAQGQRRPLLRPRHLHRRHASTRPGQTTLSYFWNDLNGDLFVQRNEIDFARGFRATPSANYDPANPASVVSPNRVDPNLENDITDEFVAGARSRADERLRRRRQLHLAQVSQLPGRLSQRHARLVLAGDLHRGVRQHALRRAELHRHLLPARQWRCRPARCCATTTARAATTASSSPRASASATTG